MGERPAEAARGTFRRTGETEGLDKMELRKKSTPFFPIGPGTQCPTCNQVYENILAILDQPLNDHICLQCNSKIDWFYLVKKLTSSNFDVIGAPVFSLIGAQFKNFQIQIVQDSVTKIDFSDYGIPEDAVILDVNYTSQGGGVVPIEVHGNKPARSFFTPSIVHVYGRRLREGTARHSTVNIAATWIEHKNYDVSRQNLAEGIIYFTKGLYKEQIIPLNTSIEFALNRLSKNFLVQRVGGKRVKDFLQTAATYSHQLNILLPIFAEVHDFQKLDNGIKGQLNRLRDLRNGIAHDGALKEEIKKTEAVEIVCAVIYSLHYIEALAKLVDDTENHNATRN